MKDFEQSLAKHFHLSEEEVTREYDSGNGRIFYDRIAWALRYMKIAGLLNKPRIGLYQISNQLYKQVKKYSFDDMSHSFLFCVARD
jgi:restriction system protein